MAVICYETETSLFEFEAADVVDKMAHYAREKHIEEAIELLNIISPPSAERITIPDEYPFFEHILFDLVGNEKGTVKCKTCEKTYPARGLRIVNFGSGESLADSRLSRQKQEAMDILPEVRKHPEMLGGKGCTCPEGHELIILFTWQS